jgi:polyisoprenoid-binding protein YceI
MRHLLCAGALVAGTLLVGSPAWATTYVIDPDHTTVSFSIRHIFTKVHGTFNEFEGTFTYVPGQPEQWGAEAVIQAASIDTRVPERDKHLRSKDFFHVEQYPTLTFTSTGLTDAADGRATLNGILSLHGVERPVALDLVVHGVASDPWGNVRAGATATMTINRKDFGLTWNQVLETGQLLVGEEIEITLEVEGIAQE